MKRILAPSACLILAFTLIFSLLFLTGCGKGEEESVDGASTTGITPGPAPQPTPPGAPVTQPGQPAQPGQQPMPSPTSPTPGMPNQTSAPTATTTPTSKPGAVAVQPGAKIPFEQVEKKSVVSRITDKDSGAVYLSFKYKDWADNISQCEVPEVITKEPRTPEAWLSTFEIYKKEVVKKSTIKKDEHLKDFPFVRRR